MAASMAALSRRLCSSLRPTTTKAVNLSVPFCTNTTSSAEAVSDLYDIDSTQSPGSSSQEQLAQQQQAFYDRPLENGLDPGVYRAIIVGQVGQMPVQKKLRSGRSITLFSVATGGIRNNRRPLQYEDPKEFANRSSVQWHRVSVYAEPLGNIAMTNIIPGGTLYLEGNLETKIFTDPITGLVRRVREVAIRRNGRIVFLGNTGDANLPSQSVLRSVGYY